MLPAGAATPAASAAAATTAAGSATAASAEAAAPAAGAAPAATAAGTTATTPALEAATAARAATFGTRTGFIHVNGAPPQFRSIQSRDRGFRFIGVRHFDEGESARLTGFPVIDDGNAIDCPILGKQVE